MFSVKKDKILRERLFFDEKKLSSKILVDDIIKISKKIPYRNKVSSLSWCCFYLYFKNYFSEIKHFLFNKKTPKVFLARRPMSEKIPGGIKKKEIINFYTNLLNDKNKTKKIKVNQLGPTGFLITKQDKKYI